MSEIYYENLSNDRKALLFLIENNSNYKYGIRRPKSNRGLNRLSTRQLVAKLRRYHGDYTKQVSGFVGYLNSFQAVV